MNSDDNTAYMLGEMKGILTGIAAQLLAMEKSHAALSEATDERLNGHSDRISRVERFQWKVAGVLTCIPIVLTIAGWIIAGKI